MPPLLALFYRGIEKSRRFDQKKIYDQNKVHPKLFSAIKDVAPEKKLPESTFQNYYAEFKKGELKKLSCKNIHEGLLKLCEYTSFDDFIDENMDFSIKDANKIIRINGFNLVEIVKEYNKKNGGYNERKKNDLVPTQILISLGHLHTEMVIILNQLIKEEKVIELKIVNFKGTSTLDELDSYFDYDSRINVEMAVVDYRNKAFDKYNTAFRRGAKRVAKRVKEIKEELSNTKCDKKSINLYLADHLPRHTGVLINNKYYLDYYHYWSNSGKLARANNNFAGILYDANDEIGKIHKGLFLNTFEKIKNDYTKKQEFKSDM